jgi:ribonuclease G
MLLNWFKKKKNKQIVINCEKLETRVAHLNQGRLQEYQLERKEDGPVVGSVYLGRIENLAPSLQAAFIDIGHEKNAFLHYWDMLEATYDSAETVVPDAPQGGHHRHRRSHRIQRTDSLSKYLRTKNASGGKIRVEDIPQLFKQGSEIIVQVTKGPIGTKGPRVSANISIPGRYLVLLPFSNHMGISKKIEEPEERRRIRKILSELDVPPGMGCICRTFGEDRKELFFKHDLDVLLELWDRAGKDKLRAPSVIFQEPNLLERTMRDFLTEDIDEIVVDDPDAYDQIRSFITRIVNDKMAAKVRLYNRTRPIFEEFGVESQISAIYERKIPLPSGGYICIDETEALVSIDINSGSLKGTDQADTILRTNLEACDEIARQLRLRNIGGLLVIDFIDMRSPRSRDAVYKKMRTLSKDDRARSRIYPISQLGLMEMSRQRDYESLRETVFDACPHCGGRGKIKSPFTMSVEIQRDLNEILRKYHREKDFAVRVIVHPGILARMKNEDAAFLDDMEKKYGSQLTFRGDTSLHPEEFKLIDPETGVEYKP